MDNAAVVPAAARAASASRRPGRRRVVALAWMALAAALGGCRIEDGDGGPTAPSAAQIAITATPDPLRFLVVCPPGSSQCFGSLDATVVIAETAGLGGRLDYVDVTVFDVAANKIATTIRLSSDWLKQQAGTDRIEAHGRLAMRPVIEGYPFPAGQPRPRLDVLLEVGFTDDKGNSIRQGARFPVE